MKIIFLDANTINPSEIDISIYSKLGDFKYFSRTAPNQIIERAIDADIILTNKVKFDKDTLIQLPKLKHIAVTATGYNIINTVAAAELGISVSNAKNYSTMAVAQQTFAMILAFSNRLAEHIDNNKWVSSPDFCYYDYPIYELEGKTLGLIGFGDIGKKVADIARVMGMQVLVYKPNKFETELIGIKQVTLESLLELSDVVSLHCPLTSSNEGFINNKTLSTMKKSAILINTARGGLINEKELSEALNNGLIAGAYLDVLSAEPPIAGNPLLTAKNCKISPHIAWAALEARQKLNNIVFNNVKNFINGQPSNIVN